MSCLFRALLLNPEVEQWLMQDLNNHERQSRLDATVLEVIRMTPPVAGFFRQSTQSIELANVAIP